jgi:hypothetical protein
MPEPVEEEVAPEPPEPAAPEPAPEPVPEPAVEPAPAPEREQEPRPAPTQASVPQATRPEAEPGPTRDALADTTGGYDNDDDEIWESTEMETGRVRPVPDAVPGELPERRVVVIDDGDQRASDATRREAAAANPEQPPAAIGQTLQDENEGQRRRWRLFRKGGE